MQDMLEICNMCKLLSNPLRLEMLARVYSAADGVNVGVLADELSQSGIGQSGVSQYLKQLASLGVIRRIRSGRYVNYIRHEAPEPAVRKAIEAIASRMKKNRNRNFAYVFGVMMNPFRARVVDSLPRSLVPNSFCSCLAEISTDPKNDWSAARAMAT